jgi:hypothetical protein
MLLFSLLYLNPGLILSYNFYIKEFHFYKKTCFYFHLCSNIYNYSPIPTLYILDNDAIMKDTDANVGDKVEEDVLMENYEDYTCMNVHKVNIKDKWYYNCGRANENILLRADSVNCAINMLESGNGILLHITLPTDEYNPDLTPINMPLPYNGLNFDIKCQNKPLVIDTHKTPNFKTPNKVQRDKTKPKRHNTNVKVSKSEYSEKKKLA